MGGCGSETDTERIAQLRDRASLDRDERAELASLLVAAADDAGEATDLDREDELIDELATLRERHDDPPVRQALATALANATQLHERGSEYRAACPDDRVADCLDRLAALDDECDDVAVEYARALANAVFLDGENREFEAAARRIERLRERYDEGPELAEQLARALAFEGWKHAAARESDEGGKEGVEGANCDEIERLYDRHGTDGIAAPFARTLSTLSITHGMADRETAREETIERLQGLYDAHSTEAVADHLVWALAIAAGDDGKAGALDRMIERVGRAEQLYEAHQTEDVATSLSKCYQKVADVFFEHERNYPKGGEALDELGALYEEYPEALAEDLALKHALAVRIYLEDGHLARAQRHREKIETLRDDHPDDDGVRDNLGDAIGELVRYHIESDNVERAQQLWDHPVADEAATAETPDHDLPESDLSALGEIVLLNGLIDRETENFSDDQTRPAASIPIVESPVVALLLTGVIAGVYSLVTPELLDGVLLDGGLGGSVLLQAAVGGVPIAYAIGAVAGSVPPMATYVPLAGIVVEAAFASDDDGRYTGVQTVVVLVGYLLVLTGAAVARPGIVSELLAAGVVWLGVQGGLWGVWLLLFTRGLVSPSITTRVPAEHLDLISATPREAERYIARVFGHVF